MDARSNRIPVIAGIITDNTRDAIKRGKAVADMGLPKSSNSRSLPLPAGRSSNERAFPDNGSTETGLPIIIYNVVPWTYLSPQLLLEIMREIPGVIGVKQSAGET